MCTIENAGAIPETSKKSDCTKQKEFELNSFVSKYCNGTDRGAKCAPPMTAEEAGKNAAKFDDCAAARDKVNQECYGGGDRGHREQADNARRAAEACRRYASSGSRK